MSLPLRLGIQQRVLPGYRAAFFDLLAQNCEGGLSVFYGPPRVDEMIEVGSGLQTAVPFTARNTYLLGWPAGLCWQRGFTVWLKTWQPDALIVEANPRYLATPSAVRWMHARQRPVIGWGLGTGGAGGLRRTFRRSFLAQFDAILTYSHQGASEYAALGIPSQRIFVAPNAAAPRPTQPPIQRPNVLTQRPNVLFVGRLQARKRIDLLLQACATLPAHQQPHLLIVGDGPVKTELEAIAKSIYPEAEFTGALHGAELEPYFRAADLFVLPGTGGLAVQQAMSYSLPVIVAEADGTQSNLVRKENGWLLPPGDLAALTATLQGALADLPALRRMGTVSYEIVKNEVNLETMAAAFEAALTFVMKR